MTHTTRTRPVPKHPNVLNVVDVGDGPPVQPLTVADLTRKDSSVKGRRYTWPQISQTTDRPRTTKYQRGPPSTADALICPMTFACPPVD